MKVVKNLELGLQDRTRFENQFAQYSDKNILWIAPQLSGRQLYKSIMPYFMLDDEHTCTAINGLGKHSPETQLMEIDVYLDSKQILWADTIVFPFTTQPLTELYGQIRSINPNIRIIYSVDFNFYQMPATHPYAKLFTSKIVHSAIEDNMFYADTVLVSNKRLDKFLTEKMFSLTKEKYKGAEKHTPVKFGCLPFLIDESVVSGNLHHEPIPMELKDDKIRIGVVATNVYADDIMAFKDTFKEINKRFEKVQLIFFGFDGKYGNKDALEGVKFEFHKPTSIIHYFKKLESLNLDLLFIPLKDTTYNSTSENYSKWLEAGLFKVPVLAHSNIYPYSTLIKNEYNGFLYSKRSEVPDIIYKLLKKPEMMSKAGEIASLQIANDFCFNERNAKTVIDIYTT